MLEFRKQCIEANRQNFAIFSKIQPQIFKTSCLNQPKPRNALVTEFYDFVYLGMGCPVHKDRSCYLCHRQLLLCRVTLGKSFLQFSAMKMAHSPPGHHSVVGRPSAGGLTYPEFVIYRGEQVRSACVKIWMEDGNLIRFNFVSTIGLSRVFDHVPNREAWGEWWWKSSWTENSVESRTACLPMRKITHANYWNGTLNFDCYLPYYLLAINGCLILYKGKRYP